MPVKRKNILTKLMKLVGGGIQVQSSKAYLKRILKEREEQRQRTSVPSFRSHLEPLPTIMEEDESLFV